MKLAVKILAAGTLALLLAAPAAAAIDAEVELRYWANEAEFEFSGDSPESNGMPGAGLRADIAVFKRLVVAGEYYKLSGEDEFDGLDQTQITLDVKWRIIAPTENTFFALGLGYQGIEFDDGESFDSSGYRIVADGRFGFVGILYVYGRLAYLPSLGDIDMEGQTFAEGDSGMDLDIGLGIEPLPILTLWVGYRTQTFPDLRLQRARWSGRTDDQQHRCVHRRGRALLACNHSRVMERRGHTPRRFSFRGSWTLYNPGLSRERRP
jgi:hypothetical protein